MGSIASANYSTHSDGNAFTVKSEYNQYDDQDQNQLLHSSEEDSGNTSENRAQQDGQYYAGDAEGARAAFALGSLGPSSGPISASRATKRTLQNRKAQREFRQRRATYLKDLEAKVRRFEAGEPAGVHPEVQHRINHLVQEIQYLRTIVDRLQQENAELRRSEAFNSPHQSLPTAGQGSYTLHPPYASTSIDRSLETYGGNALAFAEMLQPGAYPASLVNPSQHSESEQSYPAYPLQSPSHPHRLAQLSSPRSSGIYHSQQQVDWSAVRQVSGGDRPEAAAVDGVPSRPLQHHDHERSEPPQSYLHQSTNQGNAYYQPSGRPPAVRADGSAHNIHHQNSHSTSPSSAEPSHAGAIGNPYSGYSSAHNAGNNHPQGAVRPPLGAADSTSSWHSAGTPHMNFHHLAPSRDENQDYQYPHRQHPPQMQAAFQDHSRSVTQSPVAGVR